MAAVGDDNLLLIGRDDALSLIVPGWGLWHGKDAYKAIPLMCHRLSRPSPGRKAVAG